jgi:hypothetical protein
MLLRHVYQAQMAIVQIAHGRHQRYVVARAAPIRHLFAERVCLA